MSNTNNSYTNNESNVARNRVIINMNDHRRTLGFNRNTVINGDMVDAAHSRAIATLRPGNDRRRFNEARDAIMSDPRLVNRLAHKTVMQENGRNLHESNRLHRAVPIAIRRALYPPIDTLNTPSEAIDAVVNTHFAELAMSRVTYDMREARNVWRRELMNKFRVAFTIIYAFMSTGYHGELVRDALFLTQLQIDNFTFFFYPYYYDRPNPPYDAYTLERYRGEFTAIVMLVKDRAGTNNRPHYQFGGYDVAISMTIWTDPVMQNVFQIFFKRFVNDYKDINSNTYSGFYVPNYLNLTNVRSQINRHYGALRLNFNDPPAYVVPPQDVQDEHLAMIVGNEPLRTYRLIFHVTRFI